MFDEMARELLGDKELFAEIEKLFSFLYFESYDSDALKYDMNDSNNSNIAIISNSQLLFKVKQFIRDKIKCM